MQPGCFPSRPGDPPRNEWSGKQSQQRMGRSFASADGRILDVSKTSPPGENVHEGGTEHEQPPWDFGLSSTDLCEDATQLEQLLRLTSSTSPAHSASSVPTESHSGEAPSNGGRRGSSDADTQARKSSKAYERMMKNRASAKRSTIRKKLYVAGLQEEMQRLVSENMQLKVQIQSMQLTLNSIAENCSPFLKLPDK
mmetsp:Transcript_22352/g.54622  ORF Transcript_22352/g.54622 Transcript_22352/m.54622 type:complete len:196 (-) Transcript_22352:428-1015(-)